jgi:protein LTV1
MILREYNEDEEDEEDVHSHDGTDSDEAPDLITSRDDFDSMVNTFLNDFEILGRKMKPKMEGETGMEKLDAFRRAMGQDERNRIANDDEEDSLDDLFPDKDKKDRWDCETILSAHNHDF